LSFLFGRIPCGVATFQASAIASVLRTPSCGRPFQAACAKGHASVELFLPSVIARGLTSYCNFLLFYKKINQKFAKQETTT
jgi:hypothetical protein